MKTLNKKQLEEKTGETLDRLVPRFDEVLAELGEKSQRILDFVKAVTPTPPESERQTPATTSDKAREVKQ